MHMGLTTGTVALALSASVAISASVVSFQGHNSYRMGDGGEFQVRVVSGFAGNTGMASDTGLNGSAANTFQTFCVERNEYLPAFGTQVTVTIDTAAIRGGYFGGNPDPIGYETAYLYTQFRRGILSNYEYTNQPTSGDGINTRRGTARALQLAFWVLEEEYGPHGGSYGEAWAHGRVDAAGGYTTDQRNLAKAWITEAFNAGWTSIGKVRVLNYMNPNGEFGQSLLTLIPLPSAGCLALAGLLVVGVRRRRSV